MASFQFTTMRFRSFASSLISRVISPVLFLVLVLILVLASSSKNYSQKSDADLPSTGKINWAVNCTTNSTSGKQQCQMSQILTADKSGQHIMTIIIRTKRTGEKLSILLALPHGLYLPAGITYQVDDRNTGRVAMQTSDSKGVYAVFPLKQPLFEAMKAGLKFKVSMQSLKRQTITLGVSLAGFTAAAKQILSVRDSN